VSVWFLAFLPSFYACLAGLTDAFLQYPSLFAHFLHFLLVITARLATGGAVSAPAALAYRLPV